MARKMVRLVVVAAVLSGCGGTKADPDADFRQKCNDYFDQRIGHSVADDPFWETLQECARQEMLPPGENDPGFYE